MSFGQSSSPLAQDLLHRAGPLGRPPIGDGTVVRTAPSGQIYTTKPGGALFFPALAIPTGELVIPENTGPPEANRGLMMPTRRRTRSQDHAYRIALERQHNAARIARKQFLLAERIALNDEPPPF
jgi:hypothetical protein